MADGLGIEDYAIIGDCRTGALVSNKGSIDWLCWPRFDSQACFAALLGRPDHGCWTLAPSDPALKISRTYRGETNVLETVFETSKGIVAVIDFMPPRQSFSSVVRRVEGRGGVCAMAMTLALRFDYGRATPALTPMEGGASALCGPHLTVLRTPARLTLKNGAIGAAFTVNDGDVMDFALSWRPSHEAAPEPFDIAASLADTVAFWEAWSARCTYRGRWRSPVIRSLLVLKALTYAPTGGIVAALTTSLPEQIGGERNWDYRYCWLRDATLTVRAFIATGYVEEAEAWGAWLRRAVAGPTTAMQIMYGISGERNLLEWSPKWLPGYEGSAPVRVGNAAAGQRQLDVAGEMIGLLHLARRHGLQGSGSAWARQVEFVDHLLSIWQEPDEGIWEVRGGRRHFTMSKVMTWVALDRSIDDAERGRFEAPLDHWRAERYRMHADICASGYDPAHSTFTQSYGRPSLDASLLGIVLSGFLPPDDQRVLGTVAAIERDLVVDGLVLRYRTDEASGDGLTGGEGAFLACSFWLVEAYVALGRIDEAVTLFERLITLSNDVGLLAEEYDAQKGRQLGNFPQAFSHLALIAAGLAIEGNTPLRNDNAMQRG